MKFFVASYIIMVSGKKEPMEVVKLHVEKYAKGAVGHMLRHYNRNLMNFGNRDIDHLKSDLNYNLAPQRGTDDISYYKQRLSQVKCQNRADVKTLCDWVVTLPKMPFTESGERKFFDRAFDFMSKRYGMENVISAWVHKDEAGQPHLHFCFIPVCVDEKKGIEKVSAKEVLTRAELRSIHREMSDYMEQAFGCDVRILNGVTAGGNKTVLELKSGELKKEVAMLEKMKVCSVLELAQAIQKTPKLLSDISRAVRVATGKEQPPPQQQSRTQERSR